jgi:hypothetical protein
MSAAVPQLALLSHETLKGRPYPSQPVSAQKRHFWAKQHSGHFLPKTMRIVTKICQ